MATIDSIMRLMYLEDQERRRDKADEVRSVNAALTQFGRIANASATTAGTLSKDAVDTYDKEVTGASKEKIEGMKTGVAYLDNLLDSHINKINLHETVIDTVGAIEDSLSSMENTVATSGEPTGGFLNILQDHRKSLTDNADAINAHKRSVIEKEIAEREGEVEYVTRMSRWDTDMTTPEIDWDKGVSAHTKGYVQDIIEPEASVARETGDYSGVNKLLQTGPSKMRAERQALAPRSSKAAQDLFTQEVENVVNTQYAIAQSGLDQAQKSLKAGFEGSTGMKSLLREVTTNLGAFGGSGEDAKKNLPTREVLESIESDMMLLLGILDQKFGVNQPRLANALDKAGFNPQTYDPLDPRAKKVVDTFIDQQIYSETVGYRRNKSFTDETEEKSFRALRSAMTGYLTARKAIHEGITYMGANQPALKQGQLMAPGWFYPEYEAEEGVDAPW